MDKKKQIGIVVGIERLASNPLDCWVYIEQGENIQLDDIVLIETIDSGGEIRKLYGIVDEMQKTLEGADFASDAKLYPGILPTNLAEIAHISILRVEPQTFNPPNPGTAVFQASGEDFAQALYKDEFKSFTFPEEIFFAPVNYDTGKKENFSNPNSIIEAFKSSDIEKMRNNNLNKDLNYDSLIKFRQFY